ncbi:MAG: nucleotidyltransferase domain-containing protein [Acidobacteriota bacterium]
MNEGIQQSLQELCGPLPIVALYVFGSRAPELRLEGRSVRPERIDSDLDLGVQVEHETRLTAAERVSLTIALEDLFQVPRVDLVVLNETGPFLALDIIRGELLYCADALCQAEYELYVLRRAADLACYQKERCRQIICEGAR